MKINATEFGSITIDNESYPYDIIIRLSGEIPCIGASISGVVPACHHGCTVMPCSPFPAFSERRSGRSCRYGRKGCACAYCCPAGREITSME